MSRIEFAKYLIPKIGERFKSIRIENGLTQSEVSFNSRSAVSILENKSSSEFMLKKNFKNPIMPLLIDKLIEAVESENGKVLKPEDIIFGDEKDYREIIRFVFKELFLSIVDLKIIDNNVEFTFKYNNEYNEIRETLNRMTFFNAELSLLKYDMMKDSLCDYPRMNDKNKFIYLSKEEKIESYMKKYQMYYEDSVELILNRNLERIIKKFKDFFITDKKLSDNQVLVIGRDLSRWINSELLELMLEIEKEFRETITINNGFKITEITTDVIDLLKNNNEEDDLVNNAAEVEKIKNISIYDGNEEYRWDVFYDFTLKDESSLKTIQAYDDFVNDLCDIQKDFFKTCKIREQSHE